MRVARNTAERHAERRLALSQRLQAHSAGVGRLSHRRWRASQFCRGLSSPDRGANQSGMPFVWRFVILAALVAQACSIEQPISGPVSLTGEWKTITPPEPLRVAGKHRQVVCLHVDSISDADFEKSIVVMNNGQQHLVEGEATDNEQAKYPLKVRERGGGHFCLYRFGERPPGSDFPDDGTIVSLRVRSEPPLQIEKIVWHSYDQR